MTDDPAKLEEARARIEVMATAMVYRFGVEATARLLAGTLLGLLLANAGRPAALEFLADLREQLASDHPENFSSPEFRESA